MANHPHRSMTVRNLADTLTTPIKPGQSDGWRWTAEVTIGERVFHVRQSSNRGAFEGSNARAHVEAHLAGKALPVGLVKEVSR